MNKKRIFSGVQPSGEPHIGNYLGAIKNWVTMQDEFESIFCIVDLHAITVPQNPEELRRKTLDVAKVYLASGIDPEKSLIYVQSHVKEHAELGWILNTITGMSELEKMTQFKDKAGIFDIKSISAEFEDKLKSAGDKIHTVKNRCEIGEKNVENVIISAYEDLFESLKLSLGIINEKNKIESARVGLFDYPVLMAADILLYDTEVVPVGEDQLQHIELARDLAKRFNHRFGDSFVVPKAFLQKETMRIMGLDDPTKKMSKSASSEYNYISLLESPEMIEKKIKRAVTDSGSGVTYSDDRPAIKNLINIYSAFSGISPEEVVKKYEGKGFGDFKQGLTKAVLNFIIPFQEKYRSLKDEEVIALLQENAKKASAIAKAKMDTVKGKVGFLA